MNRVLILGPCGAGKSTFARKFQRLTGLELIHLDRHYWQKNWRATEKSRWLQVVSEMVQKDAWIIDGNFTSSLHLRLPRADSIIYLDYPIWKCLWRVVFRVLKHYGKSRPDMPDGCREKIDLAFLHYVLMFNRIQRKRIMREVEKVKHEKKLVTLRSDKEALRFLSAFKGK